MSAKIILYSFFIFLSFNIAMAKEKKDIFRVTLIGTGTPNPNDLRGSFSTLVEVGDKKLLFDFGRNASVGLWKLKIPLGSIDAYFLTHFHSDHMIGFPDLWLTGWIKNPYGKREKPLELYGPKGIKDFATGLKQAYAQDIKIRLEDEHNPPEGIEIHAHEKEPGIVYDKDGIIITAIRNNHGEKIQPSYGYVIEYDSHKVVISGDTKFSQPIVDAAKGADILIHCVTLISDKLIEKYPSYKAVFDHLSSPETVAKVFRLSKPKIGILSHIGLNGDATVKDLSERLKNQYDGLFLVGEDLMQIDINLKAKKNALGISIWQVK